MHNGRAHELTVVVAPTPSSFLHDILNRNNGLNDPLLFLCCSPVSNSCCERIIDIFTGGVNEVNDEVI